MSKTTPEWEIGKQEFLKRLGLETDMFARQLRLPDPENFSHIIPLRGMKNVSSIQPISWDLAVHLISRLKTMNGHMPFVRGSIKLAKFDPKTLKVGQKYAYRENLTGVLEGLPRYFENFLIPSGICELGAWFIFGEDWQGEPSLSCYLPPIIERHGKHFVIMDGIHRNYIAMQFGVSLNAILVENICIPFPCGLRNWSELKVIPLSEKPANIDERYFDLTKELFRDLKYLGIDG